MNVLSGIRHIYHTLRHVKPVQLTHRVKYNLRPVHSLEKISGKNQPLSPLSMLPVPSNKKYVEITEDGINVTFLNKTQSYQNRIQWDGLTFGRLWNYHLQYADFLKQGELSIDFRAELVLDLYRWLENGKLRPEPYPASLRIMNVIRFLSENKVEPEAESELIDYLFSELHFLEKRIEYHLLANHLMENAFALLMGGTAFKNQKWIQTAEKIFEEQVPEQILEDGAHFERSPMYHLIMLFRFLEAFHYLPTSSKLSSQFLNISNKMLGWVDQMSFENGDLAHFNDSTNGQSYSKNEVFEMAKKCGASGIGNTELSESGFRKFRNESFELLIDAEGIAPSYQPAHSHADSLSFILHVHGKPVLTDPGVSTYETNERSNWERSTKAHNTITYNSQNTAGVWSRFRVGRRPFVTILNQTSSGTEIELEHKLASGENFLHKRNFAISGEFIEIRDEVNLKKPVEGRLYFDPSVKIKMMTNHCVELTNGVTIFLNEVQQVHEFSYQFCLGFNSYKLSKALEYHFIRKSSIKITATQL